MLRDDFAVFILTHGRADNVVTADTLKRQKYSGKLYFIIDNEDDTAELYREKFGAENVIMFDKAAAVARADTMDNICEHRAILYARNESWRIAKELGLKYFLMLDDDYKDILIRWPEGTKLKGKSMVGPQLDGLFEAMLTFLDASGAAMVALAQGGDMIGGVNGGGYKMGLKRKCMNSMFCRTDTPVEFGVLFFTFMRCQVTQIQTQSLSGGMTEAYKESGTYTKSFYSVMSMPSCVEIGKMGGSHQRTHHQINWDCCVPKILNQKYRKEKNDAEHRRE